MDKAVVGKITQVDIFDFLDCYLKRPIITKKIFKIMGKSDFERSKNNNYLYFNRVDGYADKDDGLQLILDSIGSKNSKFEKNPKYSDFDFLKAMRGSTYACCFSTLDNSEFRHDYGSHDNSGKVCLTFNLLNLINQLKGLATNSIRDYKKQIYLGFGEVNYLDWRNTQLNIEELQNYITYLLANKFWIIFNLIAMLILIVNYHKLDIFMLSPDKITELTEKLERDGVEKVKANLAIGVYGNDKKQMVKNWIEGKEEKIMRLQGEREFNTLVKSNQLAETHNFISWCALGVAVIALIVSLLVAIFK